MHTEDAWRGGTVEAQMGCRACAERMQRRCRRMQRACMHRWYRGRWGRGLVEDTRRAQDGAPCCAVVRRTAAY
eukprot:scaffold138372_cov90-Phaeocystis_antarctica.AAC.2